MKVTNNNHLVARVELVSHAVQKPKKNTGNPRLILEHVAINEHEKFAVATDSCRMAIACNDVHAFIQSGKFEATHLLPFGELSSMVGKQATDALLISLIENWDKDPFNAPRKIEPNRFPNPGKLFAPFKHPLEGFTPSPECSFNTTFLADAFSALSKLEPNIEVDFKFLPGESGKKPVLIFAKTSFCEYAELIMPVRGEHRFSDLFGTFCGE